MISSQMHAGVFRRNPGFTLVELLLVVVILSVISAIAIPHFMKSYGGLQLQSVANDIAYLMRYAQIRAITKRQDVQLAFNTQLTRYWLQERASFEEGAPSQEESRADGAESAYQRIRGRWGRPCSVPLDVSIEIPRSAVSFYSDGQMEKVRIYVCDKDKERCFTVSTQEQRGRVLIFSEKI